MRNRSIGGGGGGGGEWSLRSLRQFNYLAFGTYINTVNSSASQIRCLTFVIDSSFIRFSSLFLLFFLFASLCFSYCFMSDDILELADLDLDMPAGGGSGGDFGNKSANFGGGLELLMNDSVKDKNSASSDMQLDDLTQLENQLNELVEPSSSSSGGGGVSFSFGSGGSGGHDDLDNLDDMDDFGGGSSSSSKGKGSSSSSSSAPHVGRATAQSESGTKRTWDGYAKFNNIPMNPDANVGGGRRGGGANPERDELREKTNLIRKLEQLEKKSGVELKRRPTMEMTLDELTIEYESIVEDRRKQNSIKFQGNMLMACINGLEYFNNAIDPFDLKLDGWSEQIQENIDDYDDIFGELHEKYKDRVAVSPELRLLFQLGGSAVMVHMSNTMLKSAMPSADQLFKLYPELGRDMNRAAVNQMAQTAPNFANFATNIMGVGGGGVGVGGSASGAGGSSSSGGSRIVGGPAMPDPAPRRGPGPPPPIATQGPYAAPPPLVRPGNNQHAHPELFQNSQGNNVNNNNNNNKRARTEMRGPGDISDILSGLKTRTISVPPAAATASTPSAQNTRGQNPPSQSSVPGSPVSVASFNVDGGASVNSSSVKRSNRRKRSSTNNVMSIDI